jgi:LysR family transcriptional regulator, cyn operon transcriptional activator
VDLRKLEIFARVAELKNFSQAAASLHMAQPAVSIAVRKLEESLDTKLLDRSGRRVELTAEGRNLLEHTYRILQQVEELKESTTAMKQLLVGELSIACPSMLATYFLPDLLSEFLADHPGLTASVTQAGTTAVEQMLIDDEIEVGVISVEKTPRQKELELLPLIDEKMVLCLAPDHPWASRKHVRVEELDQTPMVIYGTGYFIRNRFDLLCAKRGVTPEYRLQSNFLPLLVSMAEQGLGCTLGIEIMAEQEPGIVGIPLSPKATVPMALAKRKGRTISRANQAFLDWATFKL